MAIRHAAPALLAAAVAMAGGAAAPDPGSSRIQLDQLGYPTHAAKRATVADSAATTFAVLALAGDTVLTGTLTAAERWAPSEEVVRQAAFDRLTRAGTYVLAVAGVGRSAPFTVGPSPYHELARGAIKAFYFQRTSVDLPARFAGRWARAAGHPDSAVLVHPSAASPGRPAGTTIAAPGGWYDAGDYNKYVVNSGISTYTLLALVEHFPAYTDSLGTGIPESGNALPDALDEALWNLRWMRRMQDPADGGVYHKLTNAEFDRFEPPDEARAPRYVVQKSTAATLDFAAVAAHASLVVARYPQALPGLADSLTREALAAWRWARQHPDSIYDQRRLSARFAPAINTGEYGDAHVDDERQWAAAELFLATRADSFLVLAAPLAAPAPTVPDWGSVRTLGLYSLVDHRRALPRGFDTAALVGRLASLGDTLVARARRSPYGIPLTTGEFVWGSNAIAANQGMALVQRWRATGDTASLGAAASILHYLLGRNPTGYSFVTGYGARTPMHPHHRPSASDTVEAPVPGLLVGGPNPHQQDHCAGYPTRVPARSYVDSTCAYAANEIAINWNAPLAYLAAALDAIDVGAVQRPPQP